ncbi:MAG: GNAT family N-acetyltransferase [Acidobacteria bacterium]|nr:GNAT family N-acetyltransferase [Acidobacteriota bacterium]
MEDLASFYINEEFVRTSVSSAEHDRLLADGWRHFGQQFFRYNLALYEDEIRLVIPLRIRLSEFRIANSQERILRKNGDVEIIVGPVNITPEILDLFDRHKRRFKQHTPESIFTFIVERPEDEPCATYQQSLWIGDRLVAVGFFDVGERSVSAIYTAFDPDETRRSLGVFTILKEIEFAVENGMEFYYLGYSYSGRSFYDYKKRFHGTEAFEWNSAWAPVPREF